MRTLSLVTLLCGLALAACAPGAEEAAQEGAGGDSKQAEGAANDKAIPDSLAETAWLARAEDGARYVTYFDADGTYRDLRNGDFLQSGTWTYADGPGGKQICLEPQAENAVKMCWQPDKMDGAAMIATGPDDRRIELQRIDYVAPDAEGGDGEE